MQKLMAIFAHPDDEGAIAGTLAHYAQNGTEVTLVCATRGEVGEISDPNLATPETLGEVRAQELNTACAILGIQRLKLMDYRDSGMNGTAENEVPRALVQADPDEVIGKIVGLIRELKPDVVVTFEPFGWYGHPDHIAVYKWVTAAYPLVGDAAAYPEAGYPWQPQRLYYAVIPFSRFQGMIKDAVASGYIDGGGFGDSEPQESQIKAEQEVTHIIDIHAIFDTKQEAMAAHRTQFGEDHMFSRIPRDMMLKASGDEHFIQVELSPPESLSQNRLSDLFAGI